MKKRKRLHIRHWHIFSILLFIYDVIAIHAAYFLALWSRFDFIYSNIPGTFLTAYFHTITLSAVVAVVIFWALSLYRNIWRFASVPELERSLLASFLAAAFHCVLVSTLYDRMPYTYYIWGSLLFIILVVGIRFSYRIALYIRPPRAACAQSGRMAATRCGRRCSARTSPTCASRP